jgi:predicted nucleotidyltransferase
MGRLDPRLIETVTALVDGLGHASVRYCLIGALVPELLLKTAPPRRTNDADVVVLVETLADFDEVKRVLEDERYGFTRTSQPFRMERGPGRIDVLPYSRTLAPDGLLRVPPSAPFNMLGFDRVFESQTAADLGANRIVPLITIPLYALLKLVAYSDRRLARDPAGVLHCLMYYEEDSERLYGVEHEGALVDFDVAAAYLLGLDARPLVDEPLAGTIGPILAMLTDPESSLGFQTVREYRGGSSDERLRTRTARLFGAFRDGLAGPGRDIAVSNR